MNKHAEMAAAPAEKAHPGADRFTRASDALRLELVLRNARLREAAGALTEGDPGAAKSILAAFLAKRPEDPHALALMAEAQMRLGRSQEAETLLSEAVHRAPNLLPVRFSYANLLLDRNKLAEALAEADELLDRSPENPLILRLKASVLAERGDYLKALEYHKRLVADYPERADFWTDHGRLLRAVGLQEACIAAWRRAIALTPSPGEIYWALSNLKTFRFSEADVAAMEAQLQRPETSGEQRTYLHFALGKAYEAEELYGQSYQHYSKANAQMRLLAPYDPAIVTDYVETCKALFTRAFFEARAGWGCAAADPVFILGMPRAGSTLVEQILSSHPEVEGAGELKDLILLARSVEDSIAPQDTSDYPSVLAKLSRDSLTELGERYMRSTRAQRKTSKPFFTDKMPGNQLNLGLIQLILPNARIVDVRRHPLDCCFSNFTQHFSDGQLYTYRLSDLGRTYREYVDLMAHFDRALPGKIYRVSYEALVGDFETEVRRLLDFLGLPFDPACLRFHESGRAVRTASSEQVRTPINSRGIGRWRHYEPWLGPLKAALGPALQG